MTNLPRKQLSRRAPAAAGFTIIEIIVALIIISILTLVLVPIVSNRSREARIRAAEQEVDHLAEAQSRAAIDTGYFFRLYVLDDLGGFGDNIANDDPTSVVDGTRDIPLSTTHSTPEKIFILSELNSDDLTGSDCGFPQNYTDLFAQFTTNETAFGWHGPYINWKRDVNGNDWPDDPWGNDYILFTQCGILIPAESTTGAGTDDRFDASVVAFDRPTVLSLGPNGLPGAGQPTNSVYGTDDDIFRSF